MNLTPIKHIIWDWNGTLLDDVQLCVEIINSLLAKRSLPPLSLERYRQVFTFPVERYYEEIGFDFSSEPFESISTAFITAYERGRGRCKLAAGARETIEALAERGISQAVLSASKQNYLRQAIADQGLAQAFVAANGLDNHHAASKLDTGKAYLARQELDPAEILMVGDTLHDAEVAAAMGVSCCLVASGHQSRERLAAAGLPLIDNLYELTR